MKIKIIIPVIVLLVTACNAKKSSPATTPETGPDTALAVKTDSSTQQGGLTNQDSTTADLNGIGELHLGMKQADVTTLLGEPGTRSKAEKWDADGLLHQDWDYQAKGISINMSSEKDPGGQQIFSITVYKPCVYKTTKNVGIGSTYKEVMTAYEKMIDKTNTDKKTITAGSVYGGIIFTFGKDDRAERVFVGAAAE